VGVTLKDMFPTITDMKKIYFKGQRRKTLIPQHAVLRATLNSDIIALRRALRRETNTNNMTSLEQTLQAKLDEKRERDDAFFREAANQVRNYILDPPSEIRLARRRHRDTEVNPLDKTNDRTLLADRYVALLLSRLFNIQTIGRDHIIRALINTLHITKGSKNADRSIIKTDIQDFFATIDHDSLSQKLDGHMGVPTFVTKHVQTLLHSYNRIHQTRTGIPKGVPSSSVLAEIYLENLDVRIKQNPNVIFYSRYVDDIVIVTHGNAHTEVRTILINELKRLKLEENSRKSKVIPPEGYVNDQFDYLGYGFAFDPKTRQLTSIDVSESKQNRYLKTIRNLEEYGDQIRCWNSESDVDLYLAAYEYIYYPHATNADEDSLRIVTGLAYSAKYILESKKQKKEPERLKAVIAAASKHLTPQIGKITKKDGIKSKCKCCNRPVHRAADLEEIRNNNHTYLDFLMACARDHVDDELRKSVKELLWT